MIRPVEFLGGVALAELVLVLQVPYALVPVVVRRLASMTWADPRPCEFFAAIATGISLTRSRRRLMECTVESRQRRA